MKNSIENNFKNVFAKDFKSFDTNKDSLKGDLKKNLFYKNYFDSKKKVKN